MLTIDAFHKVHAIKKMYGRLFILKKSFDVFQNTPWFWKKAIYLEILVFP